MKLELFELMSLLFKRK